MTHALQHQPQNMGQPEFRGRIGVARREITPPAGMYTRSWGSSSHDIAAGVHQPLLATCVVFKGESAATELILLAVDVMIFFQHEAEKLRREILGRLVLAPHQLVVHPSHTHSMPMLLRKDAGKPGGSLIGPYLDSLPALFCELIAAARADSSPATLGWKYGRCGLAYNRDSVDGGSDRDVCGLNPAVRADDTVLVGRITDDAGNIRATIVNYACHPVSLGGANKLLSPDYIGTMRAVVESNVGGICVFMQGAAGDMTPRRSYEADVSAAEQNGRELAYAALSTLSAMFPPGHTLEYGGIEESGTPLGVWRVQRKASICSEIAGQSIGARLTIKDMPTRRELEAQLAARPSRFEMERVERALARRDLVGDESEGVLPFTVWRLGDALFVATPAEPYVDFQVQLRAACPDAAIAVMMASDGALNYLPTPEAYKRDVYQVRVALFETGALQAAIELTEATIQQMSA